MHVLSKTINFCHRCCCCKDFVHVYFVALHKFLCYKHESCSFFLFHSLVNNFVDWKLCHFFPPPKLHVLMSGWKKKTFCWNLDGKRKKISERKVTNMILILRINHWDIKAAKKKYFRENFPLSRVYRKTSKNVISMLKGKFFFLSFCLLLHLSSETPCVNDYHKSYQELERINKSLFAS